MIFFSNYGFKNVDLYIITLDPKKYSVNDIKELHTPLNILSLRDRKVYISSLQPSKQFNQGERNLESLSDTAIPVYV